MHHARRCAEHVLFLSFAILCAFGQNAPSVRSIDPPNWWIGLDPSPVMILLSGDDLANVTVTASHPGVTVSRVQAQPNGHYVFVWLKISSSATPGPFPLNIHTPRGNTATSFSLDRRPSPAGKYAGLSRDDLIYLIMPDRFADGNPNNNQPANRPGTFNRQDPHAYHGGDLKGVRDHLPYIKDVGATAIWLTPFWTNFNDYHGYGAIDFYGVDPHFGAMADLQQLVADAHRLGIKIVLDYVANHTGPRHPWATDPPTATWLHGTPEHHLDAVYKFNGIVDPHAPYAERRATLEGWFANVLPDLNPDDPWLATYLLENAIWWTEMTGLDAFRLDTFPYSSRQFWAGWHSGLFRAYPHTFSIGEVSDPDPSIVAFFQGGRPQLDGLDTHLSTVFDFPLMYAMRDAIIRGQPMQRIISVLERDWAYPHPELLVTFFGNHDNKRFLGEQGSSVAKLKAAYSLLFTMRGIPQIYYGDEIAMTGGDDPDNRHDFPGGFPGNPHNAFQQSGRSAEQQDTLSFVQSLTRLRAQHPALRRGSQTHLGFDDHYYAFLRSTDSERLLVVYNNAERSRTIDLDLSFTPVETATALTPIFQAQPSTISAHHAQIAVEPFSIAIYSVK